MPNPLYTQLNGGNNNNLMQMIQKFNEFKQSFTGDPRAEVQNLLNTGRMTQTQYNKLQNIASVFCKFLK